VASDEDVRRQEAGEITAVTAATGDTIVAVATAPGRAGIGVVRVSGPQAANVALTITGVALSPRRATYRDFRDGDGSLIDQGIALFYAAPNSYTGEDVLELQGHGGDAVLQLLLKRCLALRCRLAEPGEFSKRAFLNDKLDLAQAEAVADLIEASTAQAAKSAVRSLSGEFSTKVREMTGVLVNLRMFVEASLDFPEEDIEFIRAHDVQGKLVRLQEALELVLAQAQQGVLLRSGLRVVILGEPNVGKSSLLNRLAGEDIAIVTPIPGTTRDSLREHIAIEGVPIHIVDTAGLRAAQDEVEQIGIERARSEAHKADLGLLVRDATQPTSAHADDIRGSLPPGLPLIEVLNKIDLLPGGYAAAAASGALAVSAKTGEGVERLGQAILLRAGWRSTGEHALMARERHVQALMRAHTHVKHAADTLSQPELLAEELRLAQQQLGAITGEFTADDLLGEIFSRFCIGK
jgi:tRNA modification GTPase